MTPGHLAIRPDRVPASALGFLLVFPCLVVVLGSGSAAQSNEPPLPATEFLEGARSASVSVGSLTASIDLVLLPDQPDFETPVLKVVLDGRQVLEIPGVPSGFSFPATEAKIAEIDARNDMLEVYFASYSGGAHCCTEVVIATSTANGWVAVPVGSFDGDGGYLRDLDGDGVFEIVTHDNRFLYRFDCYACSAAPLAVLSVENGETVDVSDQARFLPAHRDHLSELETWVDPAERWTSPGYLAGWVAAKMRVGEAAEAWEALESNWDFANDQGEEVCLTGERIEGCPKSDRAVLKFPARLKLFLAEIGYSQ